mmetsp:Transcript_9292/g.32692  ORF Transcript_9292/g.32692 Transcript_9292/m.32692 type:complete len:549 (-) Transcript_9292:48-1694(-)
MYEASLDALVELATSGSHLDAKNDKVAALRAHVKAVHDGAIVASAGLKDSAGLEAASRPLRKGAVLFVDGADAETVWQQLQHRSRAVERWARAAELWLLEHGAGALALPSDGGDAALENEDDASMDDDEMGDDEGEEDDGGEDDGEEDDDGEEEGDEAEEVDAADDDEEEDDDEDNVERGEPGGVTENKFFSLQEMEDFIEEDEQILMTDPPPRDDDDGEEDDDEEEEEDDEMIGDGNDKYSDFFNDDGEDDAADDDGMLSDEEAALEAALDGDVAARSQTKHERQVAATKSRAREIEAENVMGIQDKPWELRGEIGAKERPQNSLLGIDATWQGRTQTAPPLDAAFTAAVEAAIRERVKEARYDELVEASLVHKALKNPKAKANAAGDDDGDAPVRIVDEVAFRAAFECAAATLDATLRLSDDLAALIVPASDYLLSVRYSSSNGARRDVAAPLRLVRADGVVATKLERLASNSRGDVIRLTVTNNAPTGVALQRGETTAQLRAEETVQIEYLASDSTTSTTWSIDATSNAELDGHGVLRLPGAAAD